MYKLGYYYEKCKMEKYAQSMIDFYCVVFKFPPTNEWA